MARLFWAGIGAVAAVVGVERVRRAARRYTPPALTEGLGTARRRTSSALGDALGAFGHARTAREKDLVAALLVTPGGDAGAVLRRPRAAHREDPWAAHDAADRGGTAVARTTGRTDRAGSTALSPGAGRRAVPPGRVDDADTTADF